MFGHVTIASSTCEDAAQRCVRCVPALSAVLWNHDVDVRLGRRLRKTDVVSSHAVPDVWVGTGWCRKDPREAWKKSMVDLVLLSMCDRILVMFESSYNNAALVRSFGEGRVTYYEHRLTHQYTDKVLTEYRRGGSHADGIKKPFAEIWDMFGPVPRAGKGTSEAVSPETDGRTDEEDPNSPIPHYPEQQQHILFR